MSEPLEDGCRQLRNVRVADDVAEWANGQARVRGVGLGVVVEEALRHLRDTEPNEVGQALARMDPDISRESRCRRAPAF